MRGWLWLGIWAVALGGPAPVLAQAAPPEGVLSQGVTQSAVVTLDRERLFEDSMMGRAVLARIERDSSDLIAENRRLEAALEAEERDLTARRASLSPAEFQTLAREFDTRVEELRVAQEAKSRALTRSGDLQQQQFFAAAVPVLAGLMEEVGAVAIIDRSAVILSFDRIDITTQAIARLDAELGDGSTLDPPAEAEVPGAASDADPQQPADAPAGQP